jgi:hypothetical protein
MSEESAAQREMPRYQCHKHVWALKIKEVRSGWNPWTTIVPEDEGYASFSVDEAYVTKHKPQAGGYYVVYDDGYKSYSPAEAFESGYTRL